jgi:hypothetical protein
MAEFDLTGESADLFTSIKKQLESYGIGDLAPAVVKLIQDYGPDMPETINAEIRKTDAYQQRFAGNKARLAAGLPVLSEAQYLYNESAYNETLAKYGSKDLATRSNFADFIAKDISPVELSERFSLAVEKVQKADPALKAQLNKMYPGISDSDLARSLLMGKEGSSYLQSKIGQAEILAEASTAGLNLQSDAATLEARGVTREKAAQGLQNVAGIKAGLEQSAAMFGDNVKPDVLQKELESEALLGQRSARAKRLASQSRAEFGGSSGITTGSLSRKKSGLI